MKKFTFLFYVFTWSFFLANAQTATKPSGNGTEKTPYQIATLEHLYWLSQSDSCWDKHFIQTADIDASDSKNWDSNNGFSPVGNNTIKFSGTYNGKGHIISGLNINRSATNNIGMFGYTGNGAEIDSIGLIKIDIAGKENVGGLAGNNKGSISNSYCSGSVSGSSCIGGLTGYNWNSIKSSYSTGNTNGSVQTGGLTGYNNGNISNSYSTSKVAGNLGVGGLTGYNKNSISNSYSSGKVTGTSKIGGLSGINDGTINNSYWNRNTSGQSTSAGGSGLSSSEIKIKASLNGFDFSSTWGIKEDTTYAVLQGINNAPFTFADSIVVKQSVDLDTLLNNDYDYETLQDSLVYKVISATAHYSSISGHTFTFTTSASVGQADTINYQAGELLANGDTLWGNTARSLIYPSIDLNGGGTESTPYIIATLDDLKNLSETPCIWNKTFLQKADIDASDTKNWNSGKGFSPIGNDSVKFTGIYNGKGHTISDLYINRPARDNIGLFGYTGSKSNIDSLGLENVNITGNSNVGGLAGNNWDSVSNSYSTGTITGNDDYTGGLLGYNWGSINNCYSTVTVTGSSSVGGLIGYNWGNINNSYSTGTITGNDDYTGGLLGYNWGEISNCYGIGSVSGNADYIGGLVGHNGNAVKNSYSAGHIDGTGSYVGGLVGEDEGTTSNSYWNTESSGQSSGNSGQGLTSAQMKKSIWMNGFDFAAVWDIREDSTYAALRNINNAPVAFPDSIVVYGSILLDTALLANDYDYENVQNALVYKVISTSAKNSTISGNNFAFNSDAAIGSTDTIKYRTGELQTNNDTLWGNTTHAVLYHSINLKGSGTKNDPYLIETLENLKTLSEITVIWDKCFRQTANINASNTKSWHNSKGFSPIGNSTCHFTGNYNGKGHSINGLYINRSDSSNIALFGYAGTGALIDSLGLTNINITGNINVGGLIGYNKAGTISYNYCSGNVEGDSCVGNLTGCNSGTITNSYSSGNVNGNVNTGGLTGYNNAGTINNTYSTCATTGDSYVGGLAGNNSGTINYSYSTDSVIGNSNTGGLVGNNSGTVTKSYWNTQTSGQSTSNGGTGLTTAQMKKSGQLNSFDFTDEWQIRQDSTYAALQGLNNAPFAFADSIAVLGNALLDTALLNNDYDYEKIHDSLVYKMISVTTHNSSINGNNFSFNSDAAIGSSDTVVYRTGELLASGDTLWSNTAQAVFYASVSLNGSGTKDDPFIIASYEDLENLSQIPYIWDKYFEQTTNIDAPDIYSNNRFSPIGDKTTNFTGNYNGKEHSINGLYINQPLTDNIGLFGYTGGNAQIDSLGLINIDITGGSYVGGLVGCNNGDTISNCYCVGNISGTAYVGGLAGNNKSTIFNSYSTGTVKATTGGGGLSGYNTGIISNSYSTGDVNASTLVGGLAGNNNGGTINYSYSTGSITGSSDTGGLTGENTGYINNSYWNTESSGQGSNNGGTGLTTAEMKDSAQLNNFDFSTIWKIRKDTTYATLQAINNAPFAFSDSVAVYGSIILDSALLANDYDYETVHDSLVYKIINVTTHNGNINGNTFTFTSIGGSDTIVYRVGERLAGKDTLWGNTALAVFYPSVDFKGSGTKDDPYIIENLENLKSLSRLSYVWDKYFIQTTDIDASQTQKWNIAGSDTLGFSPIGNNSIEFIGNYNGKGYLINGLYINRPTTDCVGLFGYSGKNAVIDSLGLINVDITGKYCVGSITGYNKDSILHCFSTGNINGNTYVGGLAGYTEGAINNSYSTGSVNGTKYAGGLTGYNKGSISNAYATGNITGDNYVGGLAGINEQKTISYSYSSGTVSGSSNVGGLVGENTGTVSKSYWDIESSNQQSGAGMGLTSEQMKIAGQLSGFDFLTVWGIKEDSTYAALQCLNNAPFAFADSMELYGSVSLDSVLINNACDYEKNQDSLVFKLINTTSHHTEIKNDSIIVKTTASVGETDTITWQTGELLVNTDTLWGNTVQTKLHISVKLKGSGTQNDPFIIATLEDLKIFSQTAYIWDMHFVQTANIDASTTNKWNIFGSDTLGFSPIGNSTTKFTGTYNGKSHRINKLFINRSQTDNIGLFGYADTGAIIDSIGLINITITGASNVGSLVGYNDGNVSNSYSTGDATGTSAVGILAGNNNDGSISNSYSAGYAYGTSNVGGLVGYNNSATISNCYSIGNVSGTSSVGGLAGYNNSGTIKNSYSSVNVNGTTDIGGLLGQNNSGTIEKSYWDTQSSGLSSGNNGTGLTSIKMKQSIQLSGFDFSTTWDIREDSTYAALRSVNNVPFAFNDSIPVYGKALLDSCLLNNDYDYETLRDSLIYQIISVTSNNFSITGNTISVIPTASVDSTDTIVYRIGELLTENDTLWGNSAQTVLYASVDLNGSGTKSDPYIIATLHDLKKVAETSYIWDKYFIQTADIEASDTKNWNNNNGFSPIGNGEVNFSGNYNGKGHNINGLQINRPSSDTIGLFGYTNTANIDSIELRHINITGGSCTGGIIGVNDSSSIKYCSVSGSISGNGYTGGLAGINCDSSVIENCYVIGSVSNSSDYTGGLAGANLSHSTIAESYTTGNVRGTGDYTGGFTGKNGQDASLSDCYAIGSVKGNSSCTGGFTGTNSGEIENSYSAGIVTAGNDKTGGFAGANSNTLTSCYYDKESSGCSSGIGKDENSQTVTALTSAQMKASANFSSFDFTTTWAIREDTTYAALQALNNAPVAFSDSRAVYGSALFDSTLLAHSYDYETLQDSLVYKQINVTSHYSSISNNIITFNSNADEGDADTITYRIGERITPGDTLWGNTAQMIMYAAVDLKGSGTASDPYQIDSLKDLEILSNTTYIWDNYFIQTKDIDAAETKKRNNGKGFSPVGNNTVRFTGSYNGKGHTIKGLFMNRPNTDYIGLFGYTGSGSNIDSLGLMSANIKGKNNIGSLVGENYKGSINYCYSTGEINGTSYIGGLVGINYNGSINHSYTSGEITGTNNNVGGLVGYSNQTINNSYSTAYVKGTSTIGGLVGTNDKGFISTSYSAGLVSGKGTAIGGLTGYNTGTLQNCYWDMEACKQSILNGGVGLTSEQMKDSAQLNGFSFSSVWAIRNDSTYAALQGLNNAPFAFADSVTVGRNILLDSVLLTNDYDYETSQDSLVCKVISTTAHYSNISNDSLIFKPSAAKGDADTITYCIGERLASGDTLWGNQAKAVFDKLFAGSGTQNDPYQIATLEDLKNLSITNDVWDKYFIQTADIDALTTNTWNKQGTDTLGFSPIGNATKNFTGNYNGKGHTISRLYINRPASSYIGLFGYSKSTTGIDSLGLIRNNITGKTMVGALVGYNETGNIEYCYNTGNITGSGICIGGLVGKNGIGNIEQSYNSGKVSGSTDNVGGVTGYNESGNIEQCYNTGNITGQGNNVAGLSGYNNSGTISNNYNTGSIKSPGDFVGGLLGKNESGSINNSYSTGEIDASGSNVGAFAGYNGATISNCYWNTETSKQNNGIGQGINSGITGLSTLQMQQAANFNSWNINTGSIPIWGIVEKSTYPALDAVKNNAPFAFPDSLSICDSVSLDSLLSGDYDYETGSNFLVYKVIDATSHSGQIVRNRFCFNPGAKGGSADTIDYRVGEHIPTGDTLWGNQATTVFTLLTVPVIDTTYLTSISDSGATAMVGIADLGYPALTAYGICWDTTTSPTLANNKADSGKVATTGTYSVPFDSLNPYTQYYLRAYAINAADTVYGDSILTFTTAKKQLYITAPTVVAKVYDQTTDGTNCVKSLGNVSGIIKKHDVNVILDTAFFDSKTTGKNKALTLKYALSGTDQNKYIAPADTTITDTILQKELNIINAEAQNKVYDGTTKDTVINAVLDSVIAGDNVVLSIGTAVFNDKTADTAKTVTVNGSAISGTDSNNYTLTEVSGLKADITPRPLHIINLIAQDKAYDGTTGVSTTGGQLDSVISGDDVTLTLGTAAFETKTAGAAKKVITSGSTISGADADNYTLIEASTTAAITAIELNIIKAEAQNKIYDATTDATVINAELDSVLPGDDVALTIGKADFDSKTVATDKKITVNGSFLSGADANSYTLIEVEDLKADITVKTLHIIKAEAQSKVYDGTVDATIANAVLDSVMAGDSVVLSIGTAFFDDKTADTAKTVTVNGSAISGTDSNNYTLTEVSGLKADITPRPLHIINLIAQDKAYDGTTGVSTTGGQLDSVISGDDVTLTLGTAAFDTQTAGAAKKVITSGSTISGADADNYTLIEANTTAAITAIELNIIKAEAQNKIYDATTDATVINAELDSVLSGDDVALTLGNATFDTKTADTDKAVTVSGSVLSGADADNYSLIEVSGLKADITAKNLNIINAVALDKIYDGTTDATIVNAVLDSVMAGDSVAFTIGTAGFDNKTVATAKTVTVNGSSISGPDANNYLLIEINGLTANISPKELNIINARAQNKIYDGTTRATIVNAALDSVVPGDDVDLSLGSADFNDKTADTAKTVTVSGSGISGTDANNYSLVEAGSLLADIAEKQLKITGTEIISNKMKDGTNTASVNAPGTLIGIIKNDDISFGVTSYYDDALVGTNKTITIIYSLSGSDSANYIAPIDSIITTGVIQDTIEINNDAISVPEEGACQSDKMTVEYDLDAGSPVAYRISFEDKAKAEGFEDVAQTALPETGKTIDIDIPANAKGGTYNATLYLINDLGIESEGSPVTFTVNLNNNNMVTKFNDIVLFNNSSNEYVSYQWYRNGVAIEGATKQFYCEEGGLNGEYSVEVTNNNGDVFKTCSKSVVSPKTKTASISVYPNPATADESFTVKITGLTEKDLDGAQMNLYDTNGRTIKTVTEINHTNRIQLPAGVYIGHIITRNGQRYTYKLLVK